MTGRSHHHLIRARSEEVQAERLNEEVHRDLAQEGPSRTNPPQAQGKGDQGEQTEAAETGAPPAIGGVGRSPQPTSQ
jgi:hypothetical protein